MRIIKPGRILTLMIPDRDDNKKIKPTKFEVISVYEHHVLTRNVRTGMRESFTWWDVWKLSQKGKIGEGDA